MGYGNSDIYVVVLLKAVSDIIHKSDSEIKECQWMNIEDYLNNPEVYEFNRFIVNQALDLKSRKLKFNLNKTKVHIGKFSRDITAFTVEDSS